MSCFACDEEAAFEVTPMLAVCPSCAKRVAAVAARVGEPIWEDDAPEHLRRPSAPPPGAVDGQAVLEAFQQGIAQTIAPEDAETHFNLGEAYLDMGLFPDARRQLAIAVTFATRPRLVEAGLQLLLAPPLLATGGLERLRRNLRAD